jgi:murein peptide amidase A
LDLSETSNFLIAGTVGEFDVGGEVFRIPRFIFMGPRGGGDTIRLGIFATVHGDEIEGAEAIVAFLRELERMPELAGGYHLYAYPLCNPSGFADRTRNNASGQDLAGQFWRGSAQPEVYYLEREMGVHCFHGVISLHSKSNFSGFRARTSSVLLHEALSQPAVQATRKLLATALQDNVEDPGSHRGALDALPPGFLTATNELNPTPFEINLAIPTQIPKRLRIDGTLTVLTSILDSYRTLLALRQNL